jgi:hypothetical protein
MYEWHLPDEKALTFQALRDGELAALVYLNESPDSPAVCSHEPEPKACQILLGGRQIASVLRATSDGIFMLEEDVPVVPGSLQVGQKWLFVEHSNGCRSTRMIKAVDRESVEIVQARACPGERDVIVATEVWKRGLGRVSVATPDGKKSELRPK